MSNRNANSKKKSAFLSERKKNRSFFNLISFLYPLIECKLFPSYQETIKQLNLPAGLTVLDVATGSGILAAAFAEQGHEVTGFDFSKNLLKRGKRKFPQIKFKKFDLYDLHKMPSKSYDIVSAGYLLHGLSPEFRKYILRHMARIAAQYVVVFDYCCRGGWFVRLIEWIEGPNYPQFVSASRSEEFGSAGLQIQKSFQTSTFGKVWICES